MICVVIQAQNERIAVAIGGHAGQTVRGAVDQPIDGRLVIGGQRCAALGGQAQQRAQCVGRLGGDLSDRSARGRHCQRGKSGREALEQGRDGRGERHRLPRRRVRDGQLIGMQTEPRRGPRLRVVERIAHHRAADVRQMDANLVRPAGFGDELEERDA